MPVKAIRRFFAAKQSKKALFLAVMGLFILLNVGSRVLFPGQILGLDYNLFHPDGICYTKQSFDFAGVNSKESQIQILNKYQSLDIDYTPNFDEKKCQVLKGRILYPLISAPLVGIFGVDGMVISSVLILLLGLFLCLLILLKFTKQPVLAMFLVSIVSCSSSFLRWGISNTTDGLLFTLSCAFLLVFVNLLEKNSFKYFLLMSLILILMTFTRRSFYIPITYSLLTTIFFFITHRKKLRISRIKLLKELLKRQNFLLFIPFFAVGLDVINRNIFPVQNNSWIINSVINCLSGEKIIAQPGSTFTSINCSFDNSSYVSQVLGAFFQAFANIAVYIFVTIGQIFVLDKLLFFFIINYLVFLTITLMRRKRMREIDFIVAFFPIILIFIASLNSTLGLNFRLELPAIPVFLLAALFSVQRFNLTLIDQDNRPNAA